MTTSSYGERGESALELFASRMENAINERRRTHLGIVDARLISRYAVAIGDPDPLYFDPAVARSLGFADVVAPPNLLAAVIDWGPGTDERELLPDGTERSGSSPGLQTMGAGEEMEIVRYVTAGADVYEERFIESIVRKDGRSGPLVFVTTVHEFSDDTGAPLSRNRRTTVVRPYR